LDFFGHIGFSDHAVLSKDLFGKKYHWAGTLFAGIDIELFEWRRNI
jgi:hypothetical protein